MKQLFETKNLCKLLVIALILAIAASIFVNLNIRRAFAESSYSVDVNSLSYEELENLTNRKTVSNDSAQITVFMHGLGCQAFHWSKNIDNCP